MSDSTVIFLKKCFFVKPTKVVLFRDIAGGFILGIPFVVEAMQVVNLWRASDSPDPYLLHGTCNEEPDTIEAFRYY